MPPPVLQRGAKRSDRSARVCVIPMRQTRATVVLLTYSNFRARQMVDAFSRVHSYARHSKRLMLRAFRAFAAANIAPIRSDFRFPQGVFMFKIVVPLVVRRAELIANPWRLADVGIELVLYVPNNELDCLREYHRESTDFSRWRALANRETNSHTPGRCRLGVGSRYWYRRVFGSERIDTQASAI